ncbi:MAG: MBL fold metallo-hydrolase [Flavobacteriales bacterium]|nr:MBL fold metallo-hydrolase [Flavobacteriales bacterium]
MASASITFLGTGTSQGVPVVGCDCAVCASTDSHDKRLRTSALVQMGGVHLLIDAGPDLRQQMLVNGTRHLDAVLLTHEHMDHVGGIDDLRAFNYRQQRAMDIHANAATLAAVRRTFHYAFAEERYPGVPELRLHTIEGPFSIGDVPVEPFEVMHGNLPVLGFRIGGLAYITDAKELSEQLVERLSGVDTLVLNALRRSEHPTHLNLQQALSIVARIGPRRAYFTHISHLLGAHEPVSRDLPAHVALAHDGLRVDFPA